MLYSEGASHKSHIPEEAGASAASQPEIPAGATVLIPRKAAQSWPS